MFWRTSGLLSPSKHVVDFAWQVVGFPSLIHAQILWLLREHAIDSAKHPDARYFHWDCCAGDEVEHAPRCTATLVEVASGASGAPGSSKTSVPIVSSRTVVGMVVPYPHTIIGTIRPHHTTHARTRFQNNNNVLCVVVSKH